MSSAEREYFILLLLLLIFLFFVIYMLSNVFVILNSTPKDKGTAVSRKTCAELFSRDPENGISSKQHGGDARVIYTNAINSNGIASYFKYLSFFLVFFF